MSPYLSGFSFSFGRRICAFFWAADAAATFLALALAFRISSLVSLVLLVPLVLEGIVLDLNHVLRGMAALHCQ